MTLRTCNECGGQVSTSATACPGCGAKIKKRTSRVALAAVGVVVLGIVYGIASAPTPQAQTQEQIAQSAQDEREFQRVVAKLRALKGAMKNPDSFELVTAALTGEGALCVTYRATNSFNAVTTGMYAITDAAASDKPAEWDRLCTGRDGKDFKHARHAL